MQTIRQIGGPNFLQEIADDVANTLEIQRYNSGTGLWDTILTANTATGNEGLTVAKGIIDSGMGHAALAADYTTPSLTHVATGLVASITPIGTQAKVEGVATVNNNTAGDGVNTEVWITTAGGSAPAAGSAPGASDTKLFASVRTSSAGGEEQGVPFNAIATGLTAGSTYQVYTAINAITGGTAASSGTNNQSTLIVHSA